MKNSLLSRFAPRETKFFPMFKQLAQFSASAAGLLVESLQHDTEEAWSDYYKRIKDIERQGDKMANDIIHELSKTFLTPFDREDIHSLTSSLDDVTDRINSSSKRIAIYAPKAVSDSGRELAALIKQAANCICQAMDELEEFGNRHKQLLDICTTLHDIENKADDVYEMFIHQLFKEETDCIELVKIKEIMHELERATDAAEHVGKVVRSLIVKYA